MFTLTRSGIRNYFVRRKITQSRTFTPTINFLSRTIRLQKCTQFSFFFSRTLSKGQQKANCPLLVGLSILVTQSTQRQQLHDIVYMYHSLHALCQVLFCTHCMPMKHLYYTHLLHQSKPFYSLCCNCLFQTGLLP